MKLSKNKPFALGLAAVLVIIVATVVFYSLAPVSKADETVYLYIDADDNVDSISAKLETNCHEYGIAALRTFMRHASYDEKVRTGRYAITPSMGAFQLYRHLSNGQQEPLKLTIPSVRTVNDLATELSEKLMLTKEQMLGTLTNNDSCAKYGVDTATVMTLFIPNTYEVYWNISLPRLMERMQKESKAFWNEQRTAKAKALHLSETEVMTLASIIDEETANNGEKPMVAGMYYNRLQKHMPLQADPTIKFALKQFALKRIYHNMLHVNSPYNTYVNEGLPPGPIRIPSVAGIDAVLNLVHHDYIYMCAKEDFSGTHNFARTYSEHLANAAKYTKALNEKGIE